MGPTRSHKASTRSRHDLVPQHLVWTLCEARVTCVWGWCLRTGEYQDEFGSTSCKRCGQGKYQDTRWSGEVSSAGAKVFLKTRRCWNGWKLVGKWWILCHWFFPPLWPGATIGVLDALLQLWNNSFRPLVSMYSTNQRSMMMVMRNRRSNHDKFITSSSRTGSSSAPGRRFPRVTMGPLHHFLYAIPWPWYLRIRRDKVNARYPGIWCRLPLVSETVWNWIPQDDHPRLKGWKAQILEPHKVLFYDNRWET